MNAPRWVKAIRRTFSWTVGRDAPQEPWWAEFWSSFATFAWAVWGLVNQPPSWSVPAFEVIGAVASEWIWFLVAASLAVWQGVVVRLQMSHGRWWASFFMAWLWAGLTLTTAMADYSRPGLAFYATFMLINLHAVLRLRTE